jgi:hypothetical protein
MTGADKEDDFVGEVVEFAGASLTIDMRSVTSEKVLPPRSKLSKQGRDGGKEGPNSQDGD